MLIHGYQPIAPYVQWYTIEPDGRCSLAEAFDAPYPAMMHDFAITENYVIFPLCPIVMDAEILMSGTRPIADAMQWKPELGMKFGVKRRQLGAPVQWFDVWTAGYMFHPGNAYEENGKIVLDACTYLDPDALLGTLRTWRRGEPRPGSHAVPYLYEIDVSRGQVSERCLDDRACEFPRLDDRLVGYRNRYGYAVRASAATAGMHSWAVVRYDRTAGRSSAWEFGDGCWPSEPVFVARTPDAAEDDGFVLCTVYDGSEDATWLAVFEARALESGPVARARLEHRLPHGFHGNFAAGVV
jgi:carotenoid cleavage dioxygenase